MGRPEASSPGPRFYRRSQAWEDCTDTQSQTRHGEHEIMAHGSDQEIRIWGMASGNLGN